MFRYIFQFFLFTSLFISGCALLMVNQTNQLLQLQYDIPDYLLFVFFATLCSYNFHWYLTPGMPSETLRINWTRRNKQLHLALFIVGLTGSAWYFFHFIQHWFWLMGSVVLTFLYSAPKLNFFPFPYLRKIAVGKTIFLAFVWMYVTTFLPIAIDNNHWELPATLLCIHRFFLIYAICIIFDYRDRQWDREQGIRSMITRFSEKGVNAIFVVSLLLFAGSTAWFCSLETGWLSFFILLLPGIITALLYPYARKSFSDYLFYFVLDGLMMLSALLMLFLPSH
ncbi:MAG: UbiA family prenyltransferase [Pseudobacter sp.]|uniref:UbiA family prenyltransferase n=1 Tax=Pseudobacter sp. TaxID=2045420 RepID=UPI003F7E405A